MGRTMLSTRSGFLSLLLCLCAIWGSVSANVPCAARQETSGYICVCNNTYCDTIERPKVLKSGKFYHYVTSATQPGFNVKTGSFSQSEELEASATSVNFVVDPSLKYQTFQGLGAGFTDSAAINFNILSAKLKNSFVQSFFGVKGLEYVFARVPVGATDFSTRFYSYDETPGDVNLTDFQLVDEDIKLRIPMMKKAMKVSKRGLKPLAAAWTAPKWMKVNNSSDIGFLRREYESAYAKYLVRYLEEYKKQGIDFWGLTHGNEILMGYQANFHMPNMVFMPPEVKTWSRDYLGPMMKNSQFSDVKIITNDDERPFLAWYARELLDDDATSKYVDGAALHWYYDQPSNTYMLDEFYAKYPDKFLIYTESSLGGGGPQAKKQDSSDLGSWSNAERYIANALQNFNHFVSGYMDWNICLNEQGGPYLQMALDPPVVVTSTGTEFYKQPFFYALGHFSKFITPGAQRINVTSDQNSTYTNSEDILDNFVLEAQPSPPGPRPTGQPGPGPSGQPGPGPTGQPGPGPTGQPGPGPTGQPGPGPQPTSTPSTSLDSLAALNPDGSHTFIVYNPTSEAVTITVKDKIKGTFKRQITAQSLNTFVYW